MFDLNINKKYINHQNFNMNIAHTGKSQASAIDIHSKIESQFLERYSRYILKDDCKGFLTDSFMQMIYTLDSKRITPQQLIQYKTHEINNQNPDVQVFFALKTFTFSHFSSYFNKILDQYNIYSKEDARSIRTIKNLQSSSSAHQQNNVIQKKQLFLSYQPASFSDDLQQVNFYELYSNKQAIDNDAVTQGEIIIFDTKIKCNSHRTKTLAYDIKKKIDFLFKQTKIQHQIIESEYLPYLQDYKLSSITIILMYNGDVNFNFSRTMNLNQIMINNTLYYVKVKVYYISKQSIFLHFKESNGQQKIESVNDRVRKCCDILRYESHSSVESQHFKRNRLIKEGTKLVNEFSESTRRRRRKTQQIITISLMSLLVLFGGYYFFNKKKSDELKAMILNRAKPM